MGKKFYNKVVKEMAKETGVNEGDVEKVLTKLGLNASFQEVLERQLGAAEGEKIKHNDLIIGLRMHHGYIFG